MHHPNWCQKNQFFLAVDHNHHWHRHRCRRYHRHSVTHIDVLFCKLDWKLPMIGWFTGTQSFTEEKKIKLYLYRHRDWIQAPSRGHCKSWMASTTFQYCILWCCLLFCYLFTGLIIFFCRPPREISNYCRTIFIFMSSASERQQCRTRQWESVFFLPICYFTHCSARHHCLVCISNKSLSFIHTIYVTWDALLHTHTQLYQPSHYSIILHSFSMPSEIYTNDIVDGLSPPLLFF